MPANTHAPLTYCQAVAAKSGERCQKPVQSGEAFCSVHLRLQQMQSDPHNPVNVFEPLPEIDMSSTPDDVINRWLRSRDEKTRWFAAKTALTRELARLKDQAPTDDLHELTDDELEQRTLAVVRLLRERRDNPPAPSKRRTSVAYDVMANLKTSHDARVSVNAALELEAYDAAIGTSTKRHTTDDGRDNLRDLTNETLEQRALAIVELLRDQRSAELSYTPPDEPPTPFQYTPPDEPEPEPETDARPVPTIVSFSDGSWEERFAQPDGSVRVRLHMPEKKPFNPFTLLAEREQPLDYE